MSVPPASGRDLPLADVRALAAEKAAALRDVFAEGRPGSVDADRELAVIQAAVLAVPDPSPGKLARTLEAEFRRVSLADRANAARWLLAQRIAAFEPGPRNLVLSADSLEQYPQRLARLLGSLEREPHDDARAVANELAFVFGALVPVGPAAGEYRSRLRLSRRGGLRHVIGFARAAAAAHGLGPYLVLHWPRRTATRFAPEAFDATYLAAADVLRLNPRLRGVCGGAWLLDPHLERVAPRLAFARRDQVREGAVIFFVRRDISGQSGALAGSRSRRQLFESGDYVPEIWMSVWPRKALLRWAAGRFTREAADATP